MRIVTSLPTSSEACRPAALFRCASQLYKLFLDHSAAPFSFVVSLNFDAMAEVFALGASVVALIQWADRVITISKNLIDSGADMSTTLRMAHAEALSLRDILQKLNQRQTTSSVSEAGVPTMLLSATKKPIDKCHATMEQLEAELTKLSISSPHLQTIPEKRQRVKQVLKWTAGGEERVKKLLTHPRTEKLTQTLAPVTDMSYVVSFQLVHWLWPTISAVETCRM